MAPRSAAALNVTELLRLAGAGDEDAQDKLFRTVYEDLRHMARWEMMKERPDHTLQPTALVHEAFVRLVGEPVSWNDRAHFFAVAATTMRRVLIDYARSLGALKRNGGQRVDLDCAPLVTPERAPELIALDEALSRFEMIHPRACRVVEMLFFSGLTQAEVAAILDVNVKTVRRDWKFARAWLNAELGGPVHAAPVSGREE